MRAAGKAKASSLGVGHPADARDNKSVAEIGERHHPLLADGASCAVGGQGQLSGAGPSTLTRWAWTGQRNWCPDRGEHGEQLCVYVVFSIDEVESSRSKALWVAAARALNQHERVAALVRWLAFGPSLTGVLWICWRSGCEGWNTRGRAGGRQRASELVPGGRLSQSIDAEGSRQGRKSNAAPAGHGEAFAVKSRVISGPRMAARNAGVPWKADGARLCHTASLTRQWTAHIGANIRCG